LSFLVIDAKGGEGQLGVMHAWIYGELMDFAWALFALLPLATHELYMPNFVALHVYALCIAWTRFVI